MGLHVGVLALQGAFRRHAEALRALGAHAAEVIDAATLASVDALVIPGGESTTIDKLLRWGDLAEPLAARLQEGMPALGTCAGMILLATEILDGRPDQSCLGVVDISVRRNAFGRQVDSFECDLPVAGLEGRPFPATFIRAPYVERVGPAVEVLARVGGVRAPGAAGPQAGEGHAVLCRQGPVMVAAFHPELSDDRRLHELFLSRV